MIVSCRADQIALKDDERELAQQKPRKAGDPKPLQIPVKSVMSSAHHRVCSARPDVRGFGI